MAVIEAIATTYLEADAASITFSSLGSYEHLQVRFNGRTTRATASESIALRLGDSGGIDTGTNYQTHQMYGQATTEAAGGETGQARMHLGYFMPTATEQPVSNGGIVCDILDYRNGSKNTTIQSVTSVAGTSDPYVVFSSGLWDDTSAVTTIQIYPNNGSDFARGTEVTLYGIQDS